MSLFEHGRVNTSLLSAKEARKMAEKHDHSDQIQHLTSTKEGLLCREDQGHGQKDLYRDIRSGTRAGRADTRGSPRSRRTKAIMLRWPFLNLCEEDQVSLSYDGNLFFGSQSQKNGRTVQDELERAISALTGEKIKVRLAGRTDRGVHADRQVGELPHKAHHTRRKIHSLR